MRVAALRRVRGALALLAALLFAVAAFAAEPTATASFDATDLALGDSVTFRIEVTDVETADGPAATDFGTDFDVRFLGGRRYQSTSVVRRDGRAAYETSSTYTLAYELRPRHAGEARVPALTVRAGGRELHTAPRIVRVQGPRETSTAFLHVACSPRRVYVEQPFDIVLEVWVRAAELDGTPFDGDPWAASRAPELRVPWFEALPSCTTSDYREFARRLLASGDAAGLRINGLADQQLFGGSVPLRFDLPHRTELRDGASYRVYELRRTFVPQKAGTLPIPVTTLRGGVVRTIARVRGQLEPRENEDVFVAHAPLSLDVLPVPQTDRPPTYAHAVGRYRVRAELTPRRVNVGDPMQLTLRIEGDERVANVLAPRLGRQPDLAAAFQVADGEAPRREDDAVVFSYVLRPLRGDVVELPPLEFASFDPEAERFVVVRTDAVPIAVEEAQSVLPSEVEARAAAARATSAPGEELVGGILGNYADEETLRDESYAPQRSPLTWLLLVLPPLVCAGAFAVARVRAAHDADPALRRERTALPRAEERLAQAQAAFAAGDATAGAAALHAALGGYVADRARVPSAGVTGADVRALLERAGCDGELARDVVAALVACEDARYGGGARDLADRARAAADWLRALERERLR